jgi:hypothetical protein
MPTLHIACETDEVSDGFHTFGELYEHRIALLLALLRALGHGWRSKAHADGSSYEGWFVVGTTLATGEITYHLPMRDWDNTHWLTTLDRAPSWDGHTSIDVIARLRLHAFLEHDHA